MVHGVHLYFEQVQQVAPPITKSVCGRHGGPSRRWYRAPLATVKVNPGDDDLVHVATVKTARGTHEQICIGMQILICSRPSGQSWPAVYVGL